jgi:hypothetical protein
MTPPAAADFLAAVEAALLPRRVPFSRAALQAFVAAAWPLIEDGPDVALWAGRFLEAGGVEVPA